MPTVVFSKESGITRELLQKEFTAKEIETRVFLAAVKLTHVQQC